MHNGNIEKSYSTVLWLIFCNFFRLMRDLLLSYFSAIIDSPKEKALSTSSKAGSDLFRLKMKENHTRLQPHLNRTSSTLKIFPSPLWNWITKATTSQSDQKLSCLQMCGSGCPFLTTEAKQESEALEEERPAWRPANFKLQSSLVLQKHETWGK